MDEIWYKLYTVAWIEKGSRIIVDFSICYGLGGMIYEVFYKIIIGYMGLNSGQKFPVYTCDISLRIFWQISAR